jgi:hypothetical protein
MLIANDNLKDKIQTELNVKYQKEWDTSVKTFNKTFDTKPTNPLLIDIPSDYFCADCKVMIFGKETNVWEGEFPHKKGIDHLLSTYKDFIKKSHKGSFWNGVSKFKDALTKRLPPGKNVSVIWNNLIKIGKAQEKGAPEEAIVEWESNWFYVVLFEIKELKPDIVIFFSGPNYDRYIKTIFNNACFDSINPSRPVKQIARVKADGLPFNSIRTYHPNYLWRHNFCKYLEEIIASLNV